MITRQIMWQKTGQNGPKTATFYLSEATFYLSNNMAWRLFFLTHINRQSPDAPCTTILAAHEWKALYTTIHRTPLIPDRPPSVRQAVRWIGQLGGFLGRKGDGEPGITALWRGWSRLADIADMYRLLHAPEEDTGNS